MAVNNTENPPLLKKFSGANDRVDSPVVSVVGASSGVDDSSVIENLRNSDGLGDNTFSLNKTTPNQERLSLDNINLPPGVGRGKGKISPTNAFLLNTCAVASRDVNSFRNSLSILEKKVDNIGITACTNQDFDALAQRVDQLLEKLNLFMNHPSEGGGDRDTLSSKKKTLPRGLSITEMRHSGVPSTKEGAFASFQPIFGLVETTQAGANWETSPPADLSQTGLGIRGRQDVNQIDRSREKESRHVRFEPHVFEEKDYESMEAIPRSTRLSGTLGSSKNIQEKYVDVCSRNLKDTWNEN